MAVQVSGSISYNRRTTIKLALMDSLVLLYMFSASFYILLFGLQQNTATVVAIIAESVPNSRIRMTCMTTTYRLIQHVTGCQCSFALSVFVSNVVLLPLLSLVCKRICRCFTSRMAREVESATDDFLSTFQQQAQGQQQPPPVLDMSQQQLPQQEQVQLELPERQQSHNSEGARMSSNPHTNSRLSQTPLICPACRFVHRRRSDSPPRLCGAEPAFIHGQVGLTISTSDRLIVNGSTRS